MAETSLFIDAQAIGATGRPVIYTLDLSKIHWSRLNVGYRQTANNHGARGFDTG